MVLPATRPAPGASLRGVTVSRPHDENEIAVGTDELDLAIESRKVDDARMHEGVEGGSSADDDLVVRCIDGQLFGPEPLQRRDITLQGGDPFLIVQRAHLFFVRGSVLFHAHPQWHANEQKECSMFVMCG
jgi:hypothetical protein